MRPKQLSIILLLLITPFLGCLTTPGESSNGTPITQDSIPPEPAPPAPDPMADLPNYLDTITNDYLTGKINPKTDPAFLEIAPQHASKKGMYMRKDAYEAFEKLNEAARQAGHQITIVSATRPFNHQKRIWEGKWNGQRLVGGKDLSKTMPDPVARAKKILEFSSMPGTSRHHWGTDIDLNNLENSYFESGKGKALYEWLTEHAIEYGYCQPYSPKGADRPYGYEEEKWHWSYLPVSIPLTNAYQERFENIPLSGFDGAETALEIGVVKKYVLGINKACK